jgi:hypothetical protein
MAKIENYQDFTIRWNGHQKYRSDKIIENEAVEVIVQKLEMLLFTGQDEVFGEDSEGFGINLEQYLWETTVAKDVIKGAIVQQINRWVPELILMGYELQIDIFEGTVRDIMELNFTIIGYNVQFVFM